MHEVWRDWRSNPPNPRTSQIHPPMCPPNVEKRKKTNKANTQPGNDIISVISHLGDHILNWRSHAIQQTTVYQKAELQEAILFFCKDLCNGLKKRKRKLENGTKPYWQVITSVCKVSSVVLLVVDATEKIK